MSINNELIFIKPTSVVANLSCNGTWTEDFFTIMCCGEFRDEFREQWGPHFQCAPVNAWHETVYMNGSANGLQQVITTVNIPTNQTTGATSYTCSVQFNDTGIVPIVTGHKHIQHAQNTPILDWWDQVNSESISFVYEFFTYMCQKVSLE